MRPAGKIPVMPRLHCLPPRPEHRIMAADPHQVPKPFRTFAVRSDEVLHALDARSPYGRVHLLRTAFLDTPALAGLLAQGFARVNIAAFSDIEHARATPGDLAAAAPGVADLAGQIAGALQTTGVLGPELGAYRRSVASRIDYLACCGAGFHNDVGRHWSRCLFWLLALDAEAVEFVMPHAGLRLGLAAGDLLVFDPAMAHGLCRPADRGQAVAASFEAGEHRHQLFLTGELLLSDTDWAALGAPWLALQAHPRLGALDLVVAQFDERSGTIQCLHGLRDCMQPSTCHVDGPSAEAAAAARP